MTIRTEIIHEIFKSSTYLILRTKLIGVCSPSLSEESSLLMILNGLFGICNEKKFLVKIQQKAESKWTYFFVF